jgi:hypothetical protein
MVMEMRDMIQNSDQHSPSTSIAPTDLESQSMTLHDNEKDDIGKLSLSDNHGVYTGSSHWVTILEDVCYREECHWKHIHLTLLQIQHLKDELSEGHSTSDGGLDSNSSDAGLMHGSPVTRISLLNSASCLSREQILSMMPSRKVADRHVSHFYNAFDIAPCRSWPRSSSSSPRI